MAKKEAPDPKKTKENLKRIRGFKERMRKFTKGRQATQAASLAREAEAFSDTMLSEGASKQVQREASKVAEQAQAKADTLKSKKKAGLEETRGKAEKTAERDRKTTKTRERVKARKAGRAAATRVGKAGEFAGAGLFPKAAGGKQVTPQSLTELFKGFGVKGEVPKKLASDIAKKTGGTFTRQNLAALTQTFGRNAKGTTELLKSATSPGVGKELLGIGKGLTGGKAQLLLGLTALIAPSIIGAVRQGRRDGKFIREFNEDPSIMDQELEESFANASLRRKLEALRAQQLQTLAQGNPDVIQQLQQIVAGTGPSELTPHETRLGGRGREEPDVTLDDLSRLLATQ